MSWGVGSSQHQRSRVQALEVVEVELSLLVAS